MTEFTYTAVDITQVSHQYFTDIYGSHNVHIMHAIDKNKKTPNFLGVLAHAVVRWCNNLRDRWSTFSWKV